MKISYVLSSDLDYGLTVAPDVGPVYAARMGWPTVLFDEVTGVETANAGQEGWMVVDNRLSERECDRLATTIEANPERLFLLKVIDPYYEWCRNHWYYRMLFSVARRPNVWFLSPYVPDELVFDLDRASGGNRLVVIPYAYPADVEQPLGGNRKPRVIFSGSQLRDVYPFRYKFDRLATWWPPMRLRVDVLEHPGYPDIGQEQKHHHIGARYIEYLARYSFMFVSPSRCRLEFLKYGESAAAGCLPLGILPNGLPADARDAFVELDFSNAFQLARSTRRALQMPADEVEARVKAYRSAFQVHRNSTVLNTTLDGFLTSTVTA